MEDNNLNKLIKDTYMEFNDEMDMHSNIEVPDFDIVMNKFHSNLKGKKKSSSISKRIALVASFTIVILISTFISSLPSVVAFKVNVIKIFEGLRGDTKDIKFSEKDDLDSNLNDSLSKSNGSVDQMEKIVSIDEAKEQVPFKVLVPEYLPNGYELENVKVVKAIGNYFRIEQTYINNEKKEIEILQTIISNNTEETLSISNQLRNENFDINNLKIRLITDDKNFKKMVWFNNNVKFEMLASYDTADNEMKEVIKSLK